MNNYQLTPLEQWIQDLYLRLKITEPSQLNIVDLAARLNVWIYFRSMTSKALEIDGHFSINIDSRLNQREQYEEFLHELCHLLRHSGNQSNMPELFSVKQEQEAQHFILYAAIPYSMFIQLELPEMLQDIAEVLVQEFGVTQELAIKRIEQIQQRKLQAIGDKMTEMQIDQARSLYDPAKWMPSTIKIMDQLDRQMKKKKGLI